MSEAHGYTAYTRGCRCDECRQAKADYMRGRRAMARYKAQKHTDGRPGPGVARYLAPKATHGTRAGYDEHGCRCEPCTAARRESDRRYRKASA